MLSKLISLASDEISLLWGFKFELERLKKNLPKVNLIICDASSNEKTLDRSQKWLKGLNEATYKAEVVLNEYNYETLQSNMEHPKRDKLCLICQRFARTVTRKVNKSLDESYVEGTRIKLVEKDATTMLCGFGIHGEGNITLPKLVCNKVNMIWITEYR